jgi:hypothetical protein
VRGKGIEVNNCHTFQNWYIWQITITTYHPHLPQFWPPGTFRFYASHWLLLWLVPHLPTGCRKRIRDQYFQKCTVRPTKHTSTSNKCLSVTAVVATRPNIHDMSIQWQDAVWTAGFNILFYAATGSESQAARSATVDRHEEFRVSHLHLLNDTSSLLPLLLYAFMAWDKGQFYACC